MQMFCHCFSSNTPISFFGGFSRFLNEYLFKKTNKSLLPHSPWLGYIHVRLKNRGCGNEGSENMSALESILMAAEVRDCAPLKFEPPSSMLIETTVHDLNNILTIISNNTALVKMHTTPEEKIFTFLTEVEKASLLAKDITMKLLNSSKKRGPARNRTSASVFLKNTVASALSEFSVWYEFSTDEVWPVDIEAVHLHAVISNLMMSIYRAMHKKGTITVCAEEVTVGAEDPLPLREGVYMKISIKAKKQDIEREQFINALDPYVTSKENSRGLATSYTIIKRHKGHITVESTPDTEGYQLYLPARGEKAAPEKRSLEEKRILIADNEDNLAHIADELLTWLECEIAVARDGTEAIHIYEKARKCGQPFHAVILNLTVCESGITQIMKKLFEIDPAVRAIASSPDPSESVVMNFRDYGFCGVITTPYNMIELSRVLHTAIQE